MKKNEVSFKAGPIYQKMEEKKIFFFDISSRGGLKIQGLTKETESG